MTILKIPSKFVPVEIGQAYVQNYGSALQKQIEEAYQAIKAEKFEDASKGDPSVTVLLASSATGAKTLIKNLTRTTHQGAIVSNAERFASRLPSFRTAVEGLRDYQGLDVSLKAFKNASGQYEFNDDKPVDRVTAALEEITSQYMNAGKYMRDRLLEEAIEEGYSVIVPTRVRTTGALNLMERVTAAGISLDTILYQAPLSVKQSRQQVSENGIAISRDEILLEHRSITKHMPELAAKASNLSIYFGLATNSPHEILKPIVSANAISYEIHDAKRAALFDGYFMDKRVSIESLMGQRNVLGHDRDWEGHKMWAAPAPTR